MRLETISDQMYSTVTQLRSLCADRTCEEELDAQWTVFDTMDANYVWLHAPALVLHEHAQRRLLAAERSVLTVLSGLHRTCLR